MDHILEMGRTLRSVKAVSETPDHLTTSQGDILHLNITGQSLLILSSLESATDLLEKRSLIYSDRAELVSRPLLPLFLINNIRSWRENCQSKPYFAVIAADYF
jgi:hypothetical protein